MLMKQDTGICQPLAGSIAYRYRQQNSLNTQHGVINDNGNVEGTIY